VANGRLLLTVMPVEQVEHEDYPADTQYLTGAVHTRGRATFRPPVYLEARIRDRPARRDDRLVEQAG
jgi:hypothetical protein